MHILLLLCISSLRHFLFGGILELFHRDFQARKVDIYLYLVFRVQGVSIPTTYNAEALGFDFTDVRLGWHFSLLVSNGEIYPLHSYLLLPITNLKRTI